MAIVRTIDSVHGPVHPFSASQVPLPATSRQVELRHPEPPSAAGLQALAAPHLPQPNRPDLVYPKVSAMTLPNGIPIGWGETTNGVTVVDIAGVRVSVGGEGRIGRPYLVSVPTENGRESFLVCAVGPRLLVTNGVQSWQGTSQSMAETTTLPAVVTPELAEGLRTASLESARQRASFRARHRLAGLQDGMARRETLQPLPLWFQLGSAYPGWDTERLTTRWLPLGQSFQAVPTARVVEAEGRRWTEFHIDRFTDGIFGEPANRSELKDPWRPVLGTRARYSFDVALDRASPEAYYVLAQWHQRPNTSPALSLRYTVEDGERVLRVVAKVPDPAQPGKIIKRKSDPLVLGRTGEQGWDEVDVEVEALWSAGEDGEMHVRLTSPLGERELHVEGPNSYAEAGGEAARGPAFKFGPYDHRGVTTGPIRLRVSDYQRDVMA